MVAGDVAEAVVDRLEPVEIDQQDRALPAARLRRLERGAEILDQLEPVGKAGQRVVARHMGDAVGGLAGAGHVRADAVIADEAALLVEGRARRKLDRPDLVADREADDQLGERLLARDRRLRRRRARGARSGRRAAAALMRSRIDRPSSSSIERPIARAKRAETFWKHELGVGLPQPVGVRAFIFAQQQADRLLALRRARDRGICAA